MLSLPIMWAGSHQLLAFWHSCVTCGDLHTTEQSPNEDKTPNCANCSVLHPTNYRGYGKTPKKIEFKFYYQDFEERTNNTTNYTAFPIPNTSTCIKPLNLKYKQFSVYSDNSPVERKLLKLLMLVTAKFLLVVKPLISLTSFPLSRFELTQNTNIHCPSNWRIRNSGFTNDTIIINNIIDKSIDIFNGFY